jgi:hypothetical protein
VDRIRAGNISTTTARVGFAAAPGVPDKILGHRLAGAVVVDKNPGPGGAGILSTTTAPATLWPKILSGTPAAAPKPRRAVVVDIGRPRTGDLKARKECHFCRCSFQSMQMCDCCKALQPFPSVVKDRLRRPYLFTDFRATAAWRTSDGQGENLRFSPWKDVPGWSPDLVHFDVMHILPHGVWRNLNAAVVLDMLRRGELRHVGSARALQEMRSLSDLCFNRPNTKDRQVSAWPKLAPRSFRIDVRPMQHRPFRKSCSQGRFVAHFLVHRSRSSPCPSLKIGSGV